VDIRVLVTALMRRERTRSLIIEIPMPFPIPRISGARDCGSKIAKILDVDFRVKQFGDGIHDLPVAIVVGANGF
jgi:hypothetical protein